MQGNTAAVLRNKPVLTATSPSVRSRFSNPQEVREFVLHTTEAIYVFKTTFFGCAQALFELSVALPSRLINASVGVDLGDDVTPVINKALAELRAESVRIAKVASDNGFALESLVYSKPVTLSATVATPKANLYLRLIIELDNLLVRYHSAWFAGFISDVEKIKLEREYTKKVHVVHSALSSLITKAGASVQTMIVGRETAKERPPAPAAIAKPEPAKKTKLAKLAALGATVESIPAQSVEAAAVS